MARCPRSLRSDPTSASWSARAATLLTSSTCPPNGISQPTCPAPPCCRFLPSSSLMTSSFLTGMRCSGARRRPCHRSLAKSTWQEPRVLRCRGRALCSSECAPSPSSLPPRSCDVRVRRAAGEQQGRAG
eukprot:762530-Hanusia_phi.AAC.2